MQLLLIQIAFCEGEIVGRQLIGGIKVYNFNFNHDEKYLLLLSHVCVFNKL